MFNFSCTGYALSHVCHIYQIYLISCMTITKEVMGWLHYVLWVKMGKRIYQDELWDFYSFILFQICTLFVCILYIDNTQRYLKSAVCSFLLDIITAKLLLNYMNHRWKILNKSNKHSVWILVNVLHPLKKNCSSYNII